MKRGLKPLGEMIAAVTLLALAGLAAPVQAQEGGQAQQASEPRVPPTHSVEQADATLARVAKDREAVNDEFAASERVCSAKFFVNNCLDKAKEKRRVALAGLRAIEVEAEHFKRADSVARRDADLAERARKDAEEQALRAAQPPKQPKVVDEKAPAAPSGRKVVDREADHEAKLQREAAQQAADAGKRAANVEAFEKKKAESERRQAEVARKKAENDAKATARAAAEKKRAEAAAAAAKPAR